MYVHWSRLGAEWEGEMTKSWWKSMSVSGVPIKSSRSMEISTRFCSQCGKLFTHVLLIFFSALELVYTCIYILLGFASSLYDLQVPYMILSCLRCPLTARSACLHYLKVILILLVLLDLPQPTLGTGECPDRGQGRNTVT